ncbi:hypothetical protein K438DRAFT_629646 [Mycena galopus ATCC 62051]|nr:hypothetical protein K438DRAFT_629646 [Mycena galopus ATCC 62051]
MPALGAYPFPQRPRYCRMCQICLCHPQSPTMLSMDIWCLSHLLPLPLRFHPLLSVASLSPNMSAIQVLQNTPRLSCLPLGRRMAYLWLQLCSSRTLLTEGEVVSVIALDAEQSENAATLEEEELPESLVYSQNALSLLSRQEAKMGGVMGKMRMISNKFKKLLRGKQRWYAIMPVSTSM